MIDDNRPPQPRRGWCVKHENGRHTSKPIRASTGIDRLTAWLTDDQHGQAVLVNTFNGSGQLVRIAVDQAKIWHTELGELLADARRPPH